MAEWVGTRPATSTEVVSEGLRAKILCGELPPGGRLVQAEIAAAFGVSITPVREAIRHLASIGLITTHPHRGAIVFTLTLDQALEEQRIRCLLEPELVRRAARNVTTEHLQMLTGLVDAMAEQRTAADLHEQFADAMFKAADSPRMSAIANGLRDRMVLAAPLFADTPPPAQAPFARHQLLLLALRNREEQRAGAIWERHLIDALTVLEDRARTAVPERHSLAS